MKKGFSTGIAILVGLVLAGAMGLMLWQQYISQNIQPEVSSPSPQVTLAPQKDDTSNWKTYRNEKYGFEVKYPQEFKIIENKAEGVDVGFAYFQFSIHSPSDDLLYFSLSIWEKEVLVTEIAKKSGTSMKKDFNGINGIERYGPVSEGRAYGDDFLFNRSNYLWLITLNPVIEGRIKPTDEYAEQYRAQKMNSPLYKNILSTFKFIK